MKKIGELFDLEDITSFKKLLEDLSPRFKTLQNAMTAASNAGGGLKGVMAGLWSVLSSHPAISIATLGITGAIAGIALYKQYVEEAVESAKEAGSAWSTKNTSLQSNIEEIRTLREELASGNLTEAEAYDAKSRLLEIQNQLVDSYGKYSEGINLVNGDLEEQIALLNQINAEEAQNLLNENKTGFKEAEKKMTENIGDRFDGSAHLASFIKGTEMGNAIEEMLQKYVDKGISTMDGDIGTGEIQILFTGNAEEASETINDLMTDLSEIEKYYGEGLYIDFTSSWLGEANSRLREYSDLYEQYRTAQLAADTTKYSAMVGDTQTIKTALNWVSDYADAILAYNEALSSGDNLQITGAQKDFEALDEAIQSLLQTDAFSQFAPQIETVRDLLNETGIAAHEFENAVNGIESEMVNKTVTNMAKTLKEAGVTDTDFKIGVEFQSDDTAVGAAIAGIYFEASKLGLSLEQICNILVEAGFLMSNLTDEVSDFEPITLSSLLSGDSEALTNVLTTYKEEMEALTAAKETLDKNGGILDETQIAELLDSCPKLADYMDDLEGGIDTLIKTADNDVLDAFTEHIEALREAGKNTEADNLQAYVNSVLESANEIEGAFMKIGNLKIETPQLTELEEASGGDKPGDTASAILSAYKEAKELYKKGEVGDPAFQKLAALISPTGSADAENFAENMSTFEKYFTDSAVGCEKFLQKLQELGVAEKENGAWTYDLGNNMEDLQSIAAQTGLGFEAFMAKFDELEKYGFKNDFFVTEEDGVEHINDLYSQLAAEKRRLAEIQANPDTEGYATAVEEAENNIAELESRIQSSKESLNEIIRDEPENITRRAEYAKKVISDLQSEIENTDDQQYKEVLQSELDSFAKEYNMVIDVNGNYVSLEEELQNLDIDVALNAKGEDLDNEITRLSEHLAELREEDEINLDTSQISSAENILTYLIQKKQELSAPAVMNISSEQLDGVDEKLSSAITAIQEYQEAYNALEQAQTLGLDTTEAQTAVDEAKASLAEIDDETKKTLNFDITGLDDAGIIESIANLDLSEFEGLNQLKYEFNITNLSDLEDCIAMLEKLPEDTQSVSVNISHGDGYTAEELGTLYESLSKIKDANPDTTVTINGIGTSSANFQDLTSLNELLTQVDNNDPAPVAKLKDEASSVADSILQKLSEINRTTVTAHINVVKTGDTDVNGNAHAHGTPMITGAHFNDGYVGRYMGNAYAKGTWGEKKDTRALTGELGPELIVRGNQFFTVGDNGPEMFNLKKGDIVFNHLQTKELLSKGYTTGRGRALATGNARANKGGGTFINGAATAAASANLSTAVSNLGTSSTKSTKKVSSLEKALEKLNNVFDWIEVKLERLQAHVDYSTAQSENEVGYTNKNAKLSTAQSYNSALISANEAGAKKYKAYAEKVKKQVGLSDSLYKKIQNGTIDIQSLSENNKKRVEAVKEWYDKMLECVQAAEELKTEQKELAQQKFDNIVTEYDNVIGRIEHAANLINEYMDHAEEKGFVDSTNYYKALISNEQQQITQMEAERKALVASLQKSMNEGTITYGDTYWEEMQAKINEVTEEITAANTNILKLNNSIRDIAWEKFDNGQDAISRITDETEFLRELMSDEDMFDNSGSITDAGMATLGLYGVDYNTYMEQANQYADEIKKLTAEINSSEENSINKDLLDRREELIDLQRESILAANDQKKAIKDLISEGIEAELDALQDLIDKYKEAKDKESELYDYQRSISEKSDTLSDLYKLKDAYSNDTSEEGRARMQDINSRIKDAEEDLKQTEYDKFISDSEDMLDQLYEEYEKVLNARLDDTSELMANMIEAVNANSSDIKTTLETQAESVGTSLTDTMDSIWGDSGTATTVLSTYTSDFSTKATNLQTTVDKILAGVERLYSGSDSAASSNITTATTNNASNPQVTTVTASTSSSSSSSSSSSASESLGPVSGISGTLKKGAKNSNVKELQKALNKLGYRDGSGKKLLVDGWFGPKTQAALKKFQKAMKVSVTGKLDAATKKAFKAKGYATGTRYTKKNELAWVNEGYQNEIITRPDGSILMPLNKGTGVVNHAQTEKVLSLAENHDAIMEATNSLLAMQQSLTSAGSLGTAAINNSNGNYINNDNQFIFNLDGVTDYKTFVTQLQHDPKFEQVVQAMTVGRMNGKSSISKYNVKF